MARKSRRANVVQEKKEELQVFASIITQNSLQQLRMPDFLLKRKMMKVSRLRLSYCISISRIMKNISW